MESKIEKLAALLNMDPQALIAAIAIEQKEENRPKGDASNIDLFRAWSAILKDIGPLVLAQGEYWNELAEQQLTAPFLMNKQYDFVINSFDLFNKDGRQKLAKWLQEEDKLARVVELGKFEWLTQMSGGEGMLISHGQFELLYKYRDAFERFGTSYDDVLYLMCQHTEGVDVLYRHSHWAALIAGGHKQLLIDKNEWLALAATGCYKEMDWDALREQHNEKYNEAHAESFFNKHVVKAGRFDIFAKDGNLEQLWENGQYKLWFKTKYKRKKS